MIRVGIAIFPLLSALFLSAACYGQVPSCNSDEGTAEGCPFKTYFEPVTGQGLVPGNSADWGRRPYGFNAAADDETDSPRATALAETDNQEGFQWRRALTESATFLVIEQAYVVHTDFYWVVSENGIPFNHYWRDYMQSLTSWWHAGWTAGEDPLYNYLGHPIQGAVTSYIEIQNDPKNEKLEFSNTRAYWLSRLKATIWNTVYSTQWSMGPLSEMTVEKYGTKDRPAWNANGTFPCNTKTCYSGVGKVNLVMTPAGGFGWMLAEDILDKKIAEELVEKHTKNQFLIDTIRCALNPIRGGANILHGKEPWYRASRQAETVNPFAEPKTVISIEQAKPARVPDRGDVFFGYTHVGPSHCEQVYFGTLISCDPLSSKASNLTGWGLSFEKKYHRYFGTVAEFNGQYGGVSQNDFLFGIRGGGSIGRLRPFAQVLVGAVRAGASGSPALRSFAEELGVGADFRLTRLLSWRNQVDELKTGNPDFERRNLRLSSGVAVGF